MSCLPLTPVGDRIIQTSQVDFSTGLDFTNNYSTIYRPVTTTVGEFVGAFSENERLAEVVQFEVEEVNASDSDTRKYPLRFLLYTQSAPTTPTANADYAPSLTNYLGMLKVATGDYTLIGAGKWRATLTQSQLIANDSTVYLKSGNDSTIYGTSIFAAVIYDAAGGSNHYVTGATVKARIWLRDCVG